MKSAALKLPGSTVPDPKALVVSAPVAVPPPAKDDVSEQLASLVTKVGELASAIGGLASKFDELLAKYEAKEVSDGEAT